MKLTGGATLTPSLQLGYFIKFHVNTGLPDYLRIALHLQSNL